MTPDCISTVVLGRPAHVTRRLALRLGAGGMAAGILLRHSPAAAQEATPPAGLFTGETFVGMADDSETFVAVVVAEGEGTQREARAYLCDGRGLDVWLTGVVDGDAVDLESEDGATLRATVAPEAVTGTVTPGDDQSFTFTAVPAEGAAGLYTLSIAEDGEVHGVAADGRGQAWGWVAAAPLLGADGGDAAYPAVLQIEPADGEPGAVFAAMTEPGQAGEGRLVVLADGPLAGGGKTKTERNFFWRDPEF